MRRYTVNRNTELNQDTIASIIGQFSTLNLPILQKWENYYNGKHKIIYKEYSDANKPISHIVVNFPREILENYAGYLGTIKYQNDNMEEVLKVINYNDPTNTDQDYLRKALLYGVAYNINYVDADGKQRFKVLDSKEVIPVYANDLDGDLLYAIRFWVETPADAELEDYYYIEVYSKYSVKKYKSNMGFSSMKFLSEEPHYFGQVPITVFKLNQQEECIFNQVIPLVDAYEELISSQLDDYSAFVDAYLKISGADMTEETVKALKEDRVMILPDGATAEYLTKDINSATVKEMLENYKQEIFALTCTPDFTKDTFNAQTGIAIRYRLIQLDNAVLGIEAQFRQALQRRIELICAILYLTGNEEVWRDMQIIFQHNLPDTLMPSTIAELVQLKGLVSNESLLGLLPFIKNVPKEMERVKLETESTYSLYANTGLEDE